MTTENTNRAHKTFSDDELSRMRHQRELLAAELPDLEAKDQMRKEAHDEPTLSGYLRRAVHASKHSLSSIEMQAGITIIMLDEFLTGERTLRSDVLDRLATILGFHFEKTV